MDIGELFDALAPTRLAEYVAIEQGEHLLLELKTITKPDVSEALRPVVY